MLALRFTGGGADRIECPAILQDPTAFTIAAWVRPDAAETNRRITNVGGTAGYFNCGQHFAVSEAWGMALNRSTADVLMATAADTIVQTTWQFVAFTWAGGSNLPQAFGALEFEAVSEFAYDTGSHPRQAGSGTPNASGIFKIGNQASQDKAFPGMVAWVGAWDRALSIDELQQQMYRPVPTAGCQGMWFPGWGGGSGNQRDHTGRGNDGNAIGTTLTNNSSPVGTLPGWLAPWEPTPFAVAGPALSTHCPVSDVENLDGWTDEGGAGTDLWQSVDDLVSPTTFAQSPA